MQLVEPGPLPSSLPHQRFAVDLPARTVVPCRFDCGWGYLRLCIDPDILPPYVHQIHNAEHQCCALMEELKLRGSSSSESQTLVVQSLDKLMFLYA